MDSWWVANGPASAGAMARTVSHTMNRIAGYCVFVATVTGAAQSAMAHCPMAPFELMTEEQTLRSDEFRKTGNMGKAAYDMGKVSTKVIIREADNDAMRVQSFDRFVQMTDILVNNYEGGIGLAQDVLERIGHQIIACESYEE